MRYASSVRRVLLVLCCVAVSTGVAAAGAAGEAECSQLARMTRWPDPTTRIESTSWRAAGFELKSMTGSAVLPAHCEVTAVMRERVGVDGQHYAIRFRLRLPQDWNRRFFFQGGGGTNGDIGDATGGIAAGAPTALARGYAVVSQDSGHDNARNSLPERGGLVAFGFDPQARADYGGASLKPVADASKAVVTAFYGSRPERSYFVGCSKGGQEGMAFAQRYPDEFDGIVSGSPGFSLPRAALAEAWDTQAFASLIGSDQSGSRAEASQLPATFSNAQFAKLREAVLAACDGDDGVKDGITANWSACDWPRVKARMLEQVCTDSPECVSRAQVDVIERVYSGAKDSKGHALYASWPLDAGIGSDGWRAWKIGPAGGKFPGINVAMGGPALAAIFTTPPTAIRAMGPDAFDYVLKFNFDRDTSKLYAADATFRRSAWADMSARSADMSAFRRHGARMIVSHGVSDPVFSINDTVQWYRELDHLNGGKAASFVRLFPVPGMAHCAGGPATDQFSAFDALVDWVEKGTAPETILAKAGPASPWPGRTRPLCAYPKVARYKGAGSIEDADSFRCE